MGCPGCVSLGARLASDRVKATKAETLRKRRYRETIRTAQALGLEPRMDPPIGNRGVRRDTLGHVPGQQTAAPNLIKGLEALAGDETASGQARVSAARAVLEAQGVLGRHATGQRDKEAQLPAGLLTRDGLVKELARLRRSVLPGTRGQAIDIVGDGNP
jgi:hypothetical protein